MLRPLQFLVFLLLSISSLPAAPDAGGPDPWLNPPPEAKLRAYWWWLNGNVDKAAITHDLEEMKAKGFGGAVIFDADGSSQGGHEKVPAGPLFGSPEWRELFAHALKEASRLDLELSLNIQSGWNLGGPSVKPEDAVKRVTWSEVVVEGGKRLSMKLPQPPVTAEFFRDTATVALKIDAGAADIASVFEWRQRALHEPIKVPGADRMGSSSAPKTLSLLELDPGKPDERHARLAEVVDLTKSLSPEGELVWNAPPGKWKVLRFGMTIGGSNKVSTSSGKWQGFALDPLDEGAFSRYWNAVVEPILTAGGSNVGKSLKFLHTDSWEVEIFNWTPTLPVEFKKRRGYDLLPWMPILTGNVIESREASQRFLADFRKTLGDLAIDHHYKPFLERSAKHGLGIHPEAGGPHYTTIDAQRALGFSTIPMSEFWAEAKTHRTTDSSRFFVKQPASASHTNGRKYVAAEGFTSVGPHWQETLWDNLKPSFDFACTEGLNRLVWHAFVCSPVSTGIPGQQYFAGTHFNPKVTWWNRSPAFLGYLDRCQMMLQRGLFHADALVYYGDHVPNYAQSRSSDPGRLGAGYDYDVVTEEAILTRLSVKDGRLVFPDGMSYRLLVLPDHPAISLPVLRKVRQLVEAGATVVGPRPRMASGLEGFPKSDTEVAAIADALWSAKPAAGRVIADKTAREVLLADGILPDFESNAEAGQINFIHRTDGDSEIYFVASRSKEPVSIQATFRVSRKAPELWDAVSGKRRPAAAYEEKGGRVTLPLDLPACGSMFVVFRSPASEHPATAKGNIPTLSPVIEISGPWSVAFDPKWGGPAKAEFPALVDWSTHSDPAIRYYSGTAVYRTRFKLSADQLAAGKGGLLLDLGLAREIASIRLNGKALGTLWAPPFRSEISSAAKVGDNELEVEVVNFWPNRIIGDASLPENQRLTRTNIRTLTAKTPLMPSGLLGPVRVLSRLGDSP